VEGHTHEEPSPKIDSLSWTWLGLCRTASPSWFLKTSRPIINQRPADSRPHGMDATRQTTACSGTCLSRFGHSIGDCA
jgi:hypothetical protein